MNWDPQWRICEEINKTVFRFKVQQWDGSQTLICKHTGLTVCGIGDLQGQTPGWAGRSRRSDRPAAGSLKTREKKLKLWFFFVGFWKLQLSRKRLQPSHQVFSPAAASPEMEEAPPSCGPGADQGREASSSSPGSHLAWSELSVWAPTWKNQQRKEIKWRYS